MGLFDFLKGKPAAPRNTLPVEALVPWVHRRSHFDLANIHAMQTQRPPATFIPMNPALAFCVAVMTDRGPLPLTEQHLEDMGLTLQQAVTHALKNVQQQVTQAAVLAPGVVAFSVDNELAGAALLFLGALAPKLPITGNPVAMFPNGNLVLVAGDGDETALRLMTRLAVEGFEASEEFRTLVAVTPGQDAPMDTWLPPPGHTLRTRFQHLAGRTAALEWRTAVSILGLEDQGPLAHLGTTGDDGALTATWMRGANVLVPHDAKRLVLVDTSDAPHARLELDNALFCRLLPWCVGELDTQGYGVVANAGDDAAPVLWRTRGTLFPSVRMRAWLVEAMRHPKRVTRMVPAQELLAAWDAGEPILVSGTTGGLAELTAPDGRTATLPLADVEARVQALAREDQAHHVTGILTDVVLSGGRPDEMASLTKLGREHMGAALKQRTPLMYSVRPAEAEEESTDGSPEVMEGLRDPAAYFPVLRPKDYAATSLKALEGLASVVAPQAKSVDVPASIGWAFQDGIQVDVVLDSANTMVALNANNLPADLHVAARNTARLNLRAATVSPLQEVAKGVFTADWRDDYAASRVLVPELLSGYPVKGETLVFIPRVNQLWLTGTDDVDALQKLPELLDVLMESSSGTSPYAWREFITAKPYVLRDGTLLPWEAPQGHAAAEIIAAMEERVATLRVSTAKDAYEHARRGAQRQRGVV